MDKIEYLFFNIYNWYYQMSLSRPKINPSGQTVFLFSASLGGWCIVFWDFLMQVILHQNYNRRNAEIITLALVFIFYYIFDRLFIDNSKYLEIYNKFKEYSRLNVKRKRDTALSFLIIFMPYLLIIVYGLLLLLGIFS